MALNITINKEAQATSFAAGATVAIALASGGTAPYVYSLATGGDKFAINSSTGVVTTIAAMDINNIASFSVTATDSTTGTALTGTSSVIYPPIQAAIQNRFNKANVIYKITNDINLNGGTLTIPEGCTLDFQGGSFTNGTIVLNKSVINSNGKCFDSNIILNGQLEGEFHSKWFGINYNSDIGELLNTVLNTCIKTDIATESDYAGGYHRDSFILDNGVYYTSVPINIGGLFIGLDFDNSTIIPTSTFVDDSYIFTVGSPTTFPEGFNGGYFKNLVIRGNNTKAKGINIQRTFGCIIQNIQCRLMRNTGIYIGNDSPEIALENIYIYADTSVDYQDLEQVYGLECVSWSDSWLDKVIVGYYPKAIKVQSCGNNLFKDIHVWGRQDRQDKKGCLRIGIEIINSQLTQFINTILDTVVKLNNDQDIDDTINGCINGGCGIWMNNGYTLTFNKVSTAYAGSTESMHKEFKTVFFKKHGYSNTFYDVRRFPYQNNAFGWASDIESYPQGCTMIGCDSINGFNQRININSNYAETENPLTTIRSCYKGENVDILQHSINDDNLIINNGDKIIYFRKNALQPANKGQSAFSQTTLGTPTLPWMAAYLRRLPLQKLSRNDSLYWAEQGALMYRQDLNQVVMRAIDGTTEKDIVDVNGQSLIKTGTTIQRPTEYINSGFQYFDTTINKPIWWTGDKWIDATGNEV